MMKRLVAVSLFIFWAAFTAILAAGLVLYGPQQSVQLPGGNTSSLVLTPEEVSRHNTPGDCWLIISNKVYDVSSYLYIHPGGAGTITPYCGKEATFAFDTKDRNRAHSAAAWALLSLYYKGDLNQPLVQPQPPANPPAPVTNVSTVPQQPPPATTQNTSVLALTPEEVAKHNSASDCWMIISNKVYDLSSYLYVHPGGAGTITPYCGKDGTVAFDTKDRNQPHSSAAQNMLSLYYKGDLNQNIIIQQQPPATPSGTVSTQQVLARFPGSQIVSVTPRGDGNYYVIFTYNGRTYRASVDPNGNLIRRQTSSDD